jgi:rRNA maturation RNase YbeY
MAKALGNLTFNFLIQGFSFKDRRKLKVYLRKKLNEERKKVERINYVFCNDAYLLEMNKQYLNHDTLTDIITFELSADGDALVADIYISVERVKENAKVFKVKFHDELLRVVFHGALHLAGYKDKRKADQSIMRQKEEEWLQQYSVSRNTVSE